jgi:Uncharacterized protein conserved in bacteria (DUF2059)
MLNKSKLHIGVAALFLTAAPINVYAQDVESPIVNIAVDDAADGEAKSREDAAFEMIAKIFEKSVDQTPINPVQLKLAETTAAKLLPNGSIKNMMATMLDTFLTPMMNTLPEMSSTEIMLKIGIYEGEIENLDEEKRKTITAMLDPMRKQRGKQIMDSVMPLLDETMTMLEPPMRTGISRAYARKFSADQLRQINGFFATPAGSAFAAASYPLQADPEVMQAVFKALPEMLKRLKTKGPELDAEIKKLPQEKTLADLNDAEMATLAGLLKVGIASLEAQRADMVASKIPMMTATDAAAESASAAAASSPYADETGEEPWYDEANWASVDHTKIKAAVKKRDEAENKSSAAYSVWADAFEKAVAKSRHKFKAEGWKPAPVADTEGGEAPVEGAEAATETP